MSCCPSSPALSATAAQADDPATWALEILTERAGRQPEYAAELLDVLGVLGRPDEAWQAAQQHRSALGARQWSEVLEQRRAGHPEDVLAPYQDLIEKHLLNSADKYRYRRAVALLPALRDAYTKAGDQVAFGTYLEELRTRHARRPAFIQTLDAAGL